MALRLGDEAPNFTAETTEGTINFYDYLGDSWGILFSHPKDFTPVCTTELGAVAKLKPEFDKRNVKVLGLSVDELDNHKGWADDIEETQGAKLNFPLIADADHKVSDLYDMIHPNANDTLTVRSVFIIGADKKVKLIITYPASTGRNFDEILRVIDSLQLTAKYSVATPVNWKDGDDVIIAGAVSDEDAKAKFPKGWKAPKPYLRITPAAQQVGPQSRTYSQPSLRRYRRWRGPGVSSLREIVVRDVLGIDAHRAVAFDEVEARQVVDRGVAAAIAAIASATVANCSQVEQRHVLRRRELDLAGRARGERFVGLNQRTASISDPSATSSPPATGPTKNQVANRLGDSSGVVQFDRWMSASASTSTPASSLASRTAAARRAREIVGRVAVVVGIDAAAGEHPRAAVERELRRTAREQHLRGRRSPSRSNTTVAAGLAAAPNDASANLPVLRSSIQLFNEELTLFVAAPQHLLVELAHRRLRHLVDEAPPLRHLPLGDVLAEERGQRRGVDTRTRLAHDARERALVPARIGHADDARLDHVGMGHQQVLELDRADPLAARLDDVLGPVGDLDEALGARPCRRRRCAASRRRTSRATGRGSTTP